MRPIASPSLRGALLRSLLAVLVVIGAASARVQSAPPNANAESGPGAAASQFYHWYLAALAANHDPLHDDPAGLSARVSAVLIREIRKKLDSPSGMEADYFIQAQDYADDWAAHITVTSTKSNAAVVVVVLGAQPSTLQRLTVTLAKEDGAWKIRRVAPP